MSVAEFVVLGPGEGKTVALGILQDDPATATILVDLVAKILGPEGSAVTRP